VAPDDNQFRDLMRRARQRDEAAAAELVRRYESAIRRVVRIHLRDARLRRVLDSMDICQSVLASFFVRTALGQYDLETPEELLHLLASIARNKLANQANRLRAQRRDIRREAAIGDHADQLLAHASDPSEQASAREILDKVRGQLDADELFLAEQRALGRGWTEIAQESGATAVALRKKLTRALDRVMRELGLEVADE
jgi:RNA polymerase sigma-70 factor (ECF subfamily)